jgi:hypothetical protein
MTQSVCRCSRGRANGVIQSESFQSRPARIKNRSRTLTILFIDPSAFLFVSTLLPNHTSTRSIILELNIIMRFLFKRYQRNSATSAWDSDDFDETIKQDKKHVDDSDDGQKDNIDGQRPRRSLGQKLMRSMRKYQLGEAIVLRAQSHRERTCLTHRSTFPSRQSF